MDFEQYRWKRQTSLKQMMDSHNGLVDELTRLNEECTAVEKSVTKQNDEMQKQFHEINDRVLTINYKVDEMQRGMNEKLTAILQMVSRQYPT